MIVRAELYELNDSQTHEESEWTLKHNLYNRSAFGHYAAPQSLRDQSIFAASGKGHFFLTMDRISFFAIDYNNNAGEDQKEFKIFTSYTENFSRASIISASYDNSVAAIYSYEAPDLVTIVTRDPVEPLESGNERVDESTYVLELNKFPTPAALRKKRIVGLSVELIRRNHHLRTSFEQFPGTEDFLLEYGRLLDAVEG